MTCICTKEMGGDVHLSIISRWILHMRHVTKLFFKSAAAFGQSDSGVLHGRLLKSHEREHDHANRVPEECPQPLQKELRPSKINAHNRFKTSVHVRRRSSRSPASLGNIVPPSSEEADFAICESER